MTRTLTALALLAFASPAMAQSYFPYAASTGDVSITGAYSATLQQPPATCGPQANRPCSASIIFPSSPASGGQGPPGGAANAAGATIYCSAACTATISVNGTAATATAGTVTPYPGSPPPAVQFFTASNAGGGTSYPAIHIAAGVSTPLDMSLVKMAAGGNGTNITITIASVTATVNITFYPLEQH